MIQNHRPNPWLKPILVFTEEKTGSLNGLSDLPEWLPDCLITPSY